MATPCLSRHSVWLLHIPLSVLVCLAAALPARAGSGPNSDLPAAGQQTCAINSQGSSKKYVWSASYTVTQCP